MLKRTSFALLMIIGCIPLAYEEYKSNENKSSDVIDKEIPITAPKAILVDHYKNMIDGVKKFETYKPYAYKCPAGVDTIGYGCTKKNIVALGYISKEKANKILLKDIEEAAHLVNKYVKVDLTCAQYAALVSFTYNAGQRNLKKLVNGPNRLNSGNYKSVENLLPLYCMGGGKKLKGLEKRRAWELSLWKK